MPPESITPMLIGVVTILIAATGNPKAGMSFGAEPGNGGTQRSSDTTTAPADTDPTADSDPAPTAGRPTLNADPLGLADGAHVLFVDGSNPNSNDNYNRTQVTNPSTPWRTPRGLRKDDYGSKLENGDIVLFRRGDYALPLIDATNRIVITEKNITLKGYPGENVVIRGSSLSPGGQPMGCNQLCYHVELMTFVGADGLIIDSIYFKGYIDHSTVNGVTGRLYVPYMMTIYWSNNVQIRNSGFTDFLGNDDIGYGLRYHNTPPNSEDVYRGLTIWGLQDGSGLTTTGLVLDNVQFRCSDAPAKMITSPYADHLDAISFITQDASNITMQNCSLGDCPANAMEFSTTSRTQANILFQNNTVHNTVKNGIQIGGGGLTQGVVVRNNRFYGVNQYVTPAAGNHGYGLLLTNSNDVAIYNNLFYEGLMNSTMLLLMAGVDSTGFVSANNNTRIYNNSFYHAGYHAIYLYNGINPQTGWPQNLITNSKIYNNLFDQINAEAAASNSSDDSKRELLLSFLNFEENQGLGNEFKNNLFASARSDGNAIGSVDNGYWLLNGSTTGAWSCSSTVVPLGCAWTSCTSSCNNHICTRYPFNGAFFNLMPLTFHWANPYAIQANIDASPTGPMFVNPDGGDFHLSRFSPAKGAGRYISEVPSDFDGHPRPFFGSSIGAYEP